MARQKKRHAEDMSAAKKRQAELDKPYSSRLNLLADRSMDSGWRGTEIKTFAKALGGQKFQVTCTPSNAKAETIKKVYSAEDLQNPKVLKDLAHLSARNHQISIQPSDSAGLILLKGLDGQDVKKLEAAGLQPAAVVSFAGKHQAWIATGATMTAEERKALTMRIEGLVDVEQKAGHSGRLVGFAGATLAVCPGHIAPAAAELLGEVKATIFEAKAAQQLTRMLDKNTGLDRVRDIDEIGGIKSLRSSWMRDKVEAVRDEARLWGKNYQPEQIERGVIEAMAKHKVPVSQAYRAVFNESGVYAGNDLAAAKVVTERYAKVALEREGRSLAGVDLQAEARTRFPEVLKQAQMGTLSELKSDAATQAQERQQDQRRLEAEAEQKRLKLEQQRAAEQLESGRDLSPTPGR